MTSVTTNVARAQRESAEIRHAALRMKKFSSGIPFPVTFLKLEQGEFLLNTNQNRDLTVF